MSISIIDFKIEQAKSLIKIGESCISGAVIGLVAAGTGLASNKNLIESSLSNTEQLAATALNPFNIFFVVFIFAMLFGLVVRQIGFAHLKKFIKSSSKCK